VPALIVEADVMALLDSTNSTAVGARVQGAARQAAEME
jgi:hypothetical protein